jgi:4-hydroxy-tetrahydrodipicolinate synthase
MIQAMISQHTESGGGVTLTWYRALVGGDDEVVDRSREKIIAFQQIHEVGTYASRHSKATKSESLLLGICRDLPADPFDRFLNFQRKQVAEVLKRMGAL